MSAAGEPPVEQCDVLDKAGLSKYRALRAKWLGWIQADPNHSIWTQIFAMISSDLAVHTIAYAAEEDADSPLHNQLLARTILQGHRDGQILGVRRLMDRRGDVISLGRLLKEINDNLSAFTRENYVSDGGVPYDDQGALASVACANSPAGVPPGAAFASWGSPLGRHLLSKEVHERFDRLSLVAPDHRRRTDRVSKKLIDRFEAHISNSGVRDILKWSHQ